MASWYLKHYSFCVPLINYILHNKFVLGYKFIYFIKYIDSYGGKIYSAKNTLGLETEFISIEIYVLGLPL
jgi:hypothetical protein